MQRHRYELIPQDKLGKNLRWKRGGDRGERWRTARDAASIITMGAAAAAVAAARGPTDPRADMGRRHYPPPRPVHPCYCARAPMGAPSQTRPATTIPCVEFGRREKYTEKFKGVLDGLKPRPRSVTPSLHTLLRHFATKIKLGLCKHTP